MDEVELSTRQAHFGKTTSYISKILFWGVTILTFLYIPYYWLNIKEASVHVARKNKTTLFMPVDAIEYKLYLDLVEKYNNKLSSIPLPNYRSATDFIEYGEPVKNVLPRNSSRTKKILKWTNFFRTKDYIPSIIRCPGNLTCETTSDREELLTSDALVFHYREHGWPEDLPKRRLPHQRWVHYLMESPHHAYMNFRRFNGLFNYTATYRRDSDVLKTYITYGEKKTPLAEKEYQNLLTGIIRNKTRLVAAMISNCGRAYSNRLAYIKEMQNYISVDVFGGCGKLKCPRGSEKCLNLLRTYKFYLSFENCNCRDYISEKVNRPLFEIESVPVVMGGADPREYEQALPPGSYIHTAGFDSPKNLSTFLQLLDRNPGLYEIYHRWRKKWENTFNRNTKFCTLCTKLYNDSLPVQTYRDFSGWYEQDSCRPFSK